MTDSTKATEKFNPDDYLLGDYVEPATPEQMLAPQSPENEEAVLACVLIDPDLYNEIAEIITANDFWNHKRRWIWQAFDALHKAGTPIDALTVNSWLTDQGYMKEMSHIYLTELLSLAPRSYNAKAYARAVEGDSLRRKYIAKANELATLAYDRTLSADDLAGKVDGLLDAKITSSKRTWQSAGEAADELVAKVESGEPVAIQTGMPRVDAVVNGGIPLEAITMTLGDASIGKSAFKLQIAEQVAFRGENALFLTLEESDWRMASRKIFPGAKVGKEDWRMNALTPTQIQDIKNQARLYKSKRGTLYFDSKARTVSQIARSVRQTRARYVVIDDLRHVRMDNRRYNASDTSELLDVAFLLKEVALDESCAVDIIHHLTADEAAKFWGDGKTKPTSNEPPSILSIAWARELRFTVDMWLTMVPDFEARKDADVMKLILWLMKDKEGSRFNCTPLYYDKIEQAFYDEKTKPIGIYANKKYSQGNTP